MLVLFGDLESGNVHKVQLVLAHLGEAYVRVDVAQTRGEPRRREFLAPNPIGRVPVVVLEGGEVLSESGAILYWFGRDTPLWPRDKRAQAEVLRWMFFEQYSHEPALAVLRYAKRFAPAPAPEERVRGAPGLRWPRGRLAGLPRSGIERGVHRRSSDQGARAS